MEPLCLDGSIMDGTKLEKVHCFAVYIGIPKTLLG